MHAVTRTYSGTGAKQLAELIESSKTDVELLMKPIPGFVSYMMIRTPDGCVTVTVCKEKAGTDESLRRAAEWVKKHGATTGAAAPAVSEGAVTIHLM